MFSVQTIKDALLQIWNSVDWISYSSHMRQGHITIFTCPPACFVSVVLLSLECRFIYILNKDPLVWVNNSVPMLFLSPTHTRIIFWKEQKKTKILPPYHYLSIWKMSVILGTDDGCPVTMRWQKEGKDRSPGVMDDTESMSVKWHLSVPCHKKNILWFTNFGYLLVVQINILYSYRFYYLDYNKYP